MNVSRTEASHGSIKEVNYSSTDLAPAEPIAFNLVRKTSRLKGIKGAGVFMKHLNSSRIGYFFASLWLLGLVACGTADISEQGQIVDLELRDGWSLLSTGVWGKETFYADGSYRVDHHVNGLEGLRWLVMNEWNPQLRQLEQELSNPDLLSDSEKAHLDFRASELEIRIATLARWEAQEDSLNSASLELQQCSPVAAASASPTSGGFGAKGDANARSCISNIDSFARASARAGTGPGFAHDFSQAPSPTYVSAHIARYGYPCESSAWAEGAPLATTSDYYGCP